MTFAGTLETSGGNATGVAVPEAGWESLAPVAKVLFELAERQSRG